MHCFYYYFMSRIFSRPVASGNREAGKPPSWVVTVVCRLANSYAATSAREAASAAEDASARKSAKYINTETNYVCSQSPLSHLAQLACLVVLFYPNSVASFPLNQAITEKPSLCFSDSPLSQCDSALQRRFTI